MTNNNQEELQARNKILEFENKKCIQIIEVGLELASQVELEKLFPLVIAKVTDVIEAERSSLFLCDYETNELWSMVAEGIKTKEIRVPFDQGIVGHVANTGECLNIEDAYDCKLFNRTIDKKTGYRTKSILCVPLKNRQNKILGVLQVLNKKGRNVFSKLDEDFLKLLAGQIAVYIENASLYTQIENLFENVVSAIAIAIDERDPVTAGHSRRVTALTMQIAKAMHLSEDERFKDIHFTRDEFKELRYACLLHDLGKVGVPEEILQKAQKLPTNWINVIEQRLGRVYAEALLKSMNGDNEAKEFIDKKLPDPEECICFLKKVNTLGFLDDESAQKIDDLLKLSIIDQKEHDYFSIKKGTLNKKELAIMQSHVTKTQSVLNAISWPEGMKNIAKIAGSHHESPDGSGYPFHRNDKDIPLGGKIMAVADVYDALTARDRPYKPAIPHEKSAEIIRGMAERKKLDINIVNFFLEHNLYKIKNKPSHRTTMIFNER